MYQTKYALTKFSCQAAKKPKINVYIWLLLLLSAGLLHHPRGDIRPTTANNNTLRFHWIEIYIQVFVVFLFFVCCSTCCLLFLILFVFVCRATSKYTYRPGEYCRGQARAVTGSRKKREKKAIRKRKYKHWCPARRCPLPPDRAYTHTHCVEALFWFCCCCSLSCFCCFALIARCAWWFWIFPTVKCANSVTVNLRMVHIFSFHLAYCLTDRGWWSFVERGRRRRLRMLRHRRRHNHSRYHREIYNHSMNGRLL